MREGKLLFSAVQFLIIAVLFSGGAAFFGLHYLPHVRAELADWISNTEMSFLLFGWLLSGVALLLTICFWAMQHSSYIRIKMRDFSVSEPVIRETIARYWEEEFPEGKSPTEIYLAKQNIEIIIDDQGQNLAEIEKKLTKLLSKQLGYDKSFFLTLTKK